MGLGKTKKQKVWCDGVPFNQCKKTPENKKENERAPFERCPVCGRRLRLKTIDCEPFGHFEAMFKFPKHKKWVKIK